MKHLFAIFFLLLCICPALIPSASAETKEATLLILYQPQKNKNVHWNGEINIRQGKVKNLEVWRRGKIDSVKDNTWKLRTRVPIFFGDNRKPVREKAENGIIASLEFSDSNPVVSIKTMGEVFRFNLGTDLSFGSTLSFLNETLTIHRVPNVNPLTDGDDEEDFPSAALSPDGSVYVVYQTFSPSRKFRVIDSEFFKNQLLDLEDLDAPAGGDRIYILKLESGVSPVPAAVTDPNKDIFRSAVAVDGHGIPWVFWCERQDEIFNLYTRSMHQLIPGPVIRLGKGPGPDLNPVAVTDARGCVWTAWQSFRNGNFDILAAHQSQTGFTEPIVIAEDAGNEWTPAIAASSSGAVAVAWDSYARGSYDVYYRESASGAAFAPAIPVAASRQHEARPALTYDSNGRLWVAYENGPSNWGKDNGRFSHKGSTPIYPADLNIRLKCFKDGKAYQTLGPLPEHSSPQSYPRLAADPDGRIWLAFRSKDPRFWCQFGSSWFEYLTYYEGGDWSNPVIAPGSSNLLDNRPALLCPEGGRLMMLASSDGRRKYSGYRGAYRNRPGGTKAEQISNDILVFRTQLKNTPQTPLTLKQIDPEIPEEPTGRKEAKAVLQCRNYRIHAGDKSYRLMRGDFHRHTSLSVDGAWDGSLSDLYRYSLDAASLDWVASSDHSGRKFREYNWWVGQKAADAFLAPLHFTSLFAYERSIRYPIGHRNALFAQRGTRPLPALTVVPEKLSDPESDLPILYRYLEKYGGICAAHTTATKMGTDWTHHHEELEPVVEIYQGKRNNYEEPNAPRAEVLENGDENDFSSGYVWEALAKGLRLGFVASSDHGSTHMSYANVWVEEPTREGIMRAVKKRHTYASTDNIIADFRCGEHIMGDALNLDEKPVFQIKLVGTADFKDVVIVKDGTYVHRLHPHQPTVEFEWSDEASGPGTSYYYVRAEQTDDELVWTSPMWISRK